jgi:YegS/Rv2252/BmrU family lipid kinase
MSSEPVPLFINPIAGRGRAGREASSIRDLLGTCGVTAELIESTTAGDLEEKVFRASVAGADRVIVAGGDGSVHEVVNGLLRAKSDTAFGVIPLGTGNDFAKACSIPLNWEDATALLANRLCDQAAVRYVDAGRMNERFFANSAGIGFDAKINRIASNLRLPIGDLVYLIAVFQGMWDGVITPNVKISYDGGKYEGPITLANISNGPWVGGMFHIAPMAKINDGNLDLVFVSPVDRLRILFLLPKLIKGTHINEAEVTCTTIKSFELVADEPVPSHLDGEVQPLQTEFRIELLENALRLL